MAAAGTGLGQCSVPQAAAWPEVKAGRGQKRLEWKGKRSSKAVGRAQKWHVGRRKEKTKLLDLPTSSAPSAAIGRG